MRWYVVNTLPHQENRANLNLRQQGFESWLPKFARTRRHARRIEQVYSPIFPGYLFVKLDLLRQHWPAINGTFGVRRLLCTQDCPAPIPDEFIDALQSTLDEAGLVAVPRDAFRVGDRVRLVSGPFADTVATLIGLADGDRVNVLLNVLGGEVRAMISRRLLAIVS